MRIVLTTLARTWWQMSCLAVRECQAVLQAMAQKRQDGTELMQQSLVAYLCGGSLGDQQLSRRVLVPRTRKGPQQ